MSRIGNRVLIIPQGVTLTVANNNIHVQGPKGTVDISYKQASLIKVNVQQNNVRLEPTNQVKTTKMLHGTLNALIANALHGVVEPWSIKLVLVGVGYRASVKNDKLVLGLGYSHLVELTIPTDLTVTCPTSTEIIITGANKDFVGRFASKIRAWRLPEPYKGKGVLFAGEQIVRKAGKTAESSKK